MYIACHILALSLCHTQSLTLSLSLFLMLTLVRQIVWNGLPRLLSQWRNIESGKSNASSGLIEFLHQRG